MGGCNSSNKTMKKPKRTFKLDKAGPTSKAFKIVFLGDISVGKTSLLWRFIKSDFLEAHTPTVGLAYSQHKIKIENDVSHPHYEETYYFSQFPTFFKKSIK